MSPGCFLGGASLVLLRLSAGLRGRLTVQFEATSGFWHFYITESVIAQVVLELGHLVRLAVDEECLFAMGD